MKIERDEVNDITYIDFELDSDIDHTGVLYEDGLNIDFDYHGEIKGIEIFNSKHLQKAIRLLYNIMELIDERPIE